MVRSSQFPDCCRRSAGDDDGDYCYCGSAVAAAAEDGWFRCDEAGGDCEDGDDGGGVSDGGAALPRCLPSPGSPSMTLPAFSAYCGRDASSLGYRCFQPFF